MKKILLSVIALAMISVTIGFVACKKEKDTINEKQNQNENVNPYDDYFSKYSKDAVKSIIEISNTRIGYEEWSAKVDSIINSLDMSAFSSEIDALKQIKDSSDIRLIDTFFDNLATMDAYRSARIVEKQVYSSNRSEKDKKACLFLLSYMKTILANIEGTEVFLSGGGYKRYLDCMRDKHSNMNWIDKTEFILGCPWSFAWEVASCIWNATHSEQ